MGRIKLEYGRLVEMKAYRITALSSLHEEIRKLYLKGRRYKRIGSYLRTRGVEVELTTLYKYIKRYKISREGEVEDLLSSEELGIEVYQVKLGEPVIGLEEVKRRIKGRKQSRKEVKKVEVITSNKEVLPVHSIPKIAGSELAQPVKKAGNFKKSYVPSIAWGEVPEAAMSGAYIWYPWSLRVTEMQWREKGPIYRGEDFLSGEIGEVGMDEKGKLVRGWEGAFWRVKSLRDLTQAELYWMMRKRMEWMKAKEREMIELGISEEEWRELDRENLLRVSLPEGVGLDEFVGGLSTELLEWAVRRYLYMMGDPAGEREWWLAAYRGKGGRVDKEAVEHYAETRNE